ncbi:hypothetical protein [Alkalimarinus alittae]|uniref:Uncharacterized protein n=1 Tax=Alkalimarinus alittae TaxID=2961619 RepID=A0ABY6N3L9_9ALTE|nr:hypothetical protein [Alkalimarinus alittae]UZE96607.1 hypothetical protein NKI27_02320 [Alkalimarinus alittae]
MSLFLSQREIRGLIKVGDLVIPGGYGFPSFSETGCIDHVDEVMAPTPAADVKDFKLLMKVFSVAPNALLKGLLRLMDKESAFPEPIGGLLRLLNVGVKGVVFSLYYSNKTSEFYQGPLVHEAIGYQVNCEMDESNGSAGQ